MNKFWIKESGTSTYHHIEIESINMICSTTNKTGSKGYVNLHLEGSGDSPINVLQSSRVLSEKLNELGGNFMIIDRGTVVNMNRSTKLDTFKLHVIFNGKERIYSVSRRTGEVIRSKSIHKKQA